LVGNRILKEEISQKIKTCMKKKIDLADTNLNLAIARPAKLEEEESSPRGRKEPFELPFVVDIINRVESLSF
jgi:hypothetical protein